MNGSNTPVLTVKEGLNALDDRRIKSIRPLVPPQILMEDFPLSFKAAATVLEGRKDCENIINRLDDRLIVVVGPCSIHDIKAALEYAKLLKVYADECSSDLKIIMRVYFEKPRTTVGWKGLINDPQLNGTFQINKGLRLARGLLLEIGNLGIPAGVEYLDCISPQYIADLVSWGAIGARTTESANHRTLASGLSVPVGFKNGTDGSVQIAVDAIISSSASHSFLSVTKQGISAIVETDGNPFGHVILRGSNSGPNFTKEHVLRARDLLKKEGLKTGIMIDASHGNSEKKFERQVGVIEDVVRQLGDIEVAECILGVMIESHLVEGKQSIPSTGPSTLIYGQSVTDGCISWDTTVATLNKLRVGVQNRRKLNLNGSNGAGELNRLARQVGEENEEEEKKDFNDVDYFPVA